AEANITYNVSGIYYRALAVAGVEGGFRGLDGMATTDVLPVAEKALAYARENEADLKQYEPDNGWGSVNCVYRVLGVLIEVCKKDEAGAVVRVQ
ncbi:unnamed protein product, partial [marine sediment metagenome]